MSEVRAAASEVRAAARAAASEGLTDWLANLVRIHVGAHSRDVASHLEITHGTGVLDNLTNIRLNGSCWLS